MQTRSDRGACFLANRLHQGSLVCFLKHIAGLVIYVLAPCAFKITRKVKSSYVLGFGQYYGSSIMNHGLHLLI
jgi:nitrate reductase gamma subunit